MSVIEVNHVIKEYRLGASNGLKQTLLNTGARLLGKSVPEPPLFKALDDVSFSIEQGEVVGIIGHNGAGKSTLLKMLAQINTPTHGSVKVNGRIAPLIEVGAGFVPDFTGRENVYLNGSILGMSRQEIDKKFDEIVDFAEMAEFIDTPVKRYSSGMQVKLAFSVATSVEAEILIVDEVLAVGDLAFQRKCFDRMLNLIKGQGKTVLLVSHNIRQIEKFCSRVLLLDHGRLIQDGPSIETCNLFYEISERKIKQQLLHDSVKADGGRRIGNGDVQLIQTRMFDESGQEVNQFQYGSDIRILFTFQSAIDLHDPFFGMGIQTVDLLSLVSEDSDTKFFASKVPKGEFTLSCTLKALSLLPGVYCIRAGVQMGQSMETLYYEENIISFHIVTDGKVKSGIFKEAFILAPVEFEIVS